MIFSREFFYHLASEGLRKNEKFLKTILNKNINNWKNGTSKNKKALIFYQGPKSIYN